MEICVLFTCFILVSGLLTLSAMPVKCCESIRIFGLNGKHPLMFFPNGNSQPNFLEIGVNCKQQRTTLPYAFTLMSLEIKQQNNNKTLAMHDLSRPVFTNLTLQKCTCTGINKNYYTEDTSTIPLMFACFASPCSADPCEL